MNWPSHQQMAKAHILLLGGVKPLIYEFPSAYLGTKILRTGVSERAKNGSIQEVCT